MSCAASSVSKILYDSKTNEITFKSPDFWVIVAGIRRFVEEEGNGRLPLSPELPDMHSTTDQYLSLQSLYRVKFEEDVSSVCNHVSTILNSVGRDENSISRKDISLVCLNSRTLRVVRTKPLLDVKSLYASDEIKNALSNEGMSNAASLFVILNTIDSFHEENNRFPGATGADVEEDAAVLKGLLATVADVSTAMAVNDDMIHEMVRFGGSELHSVASIMGAMASQEVIKLLTSQCVPLSGTLIYDGMNCHTLVLNFY